MVTAWTLDCASALNLLATAFTTNHVVTHEFHRLTQDIVTHRAKQCWRYAAQYVASVSLCTNADGVVARMCSTAATGLLPVAGRPRFLVALAFVPPRATASKC